MRKVTTYVPAAPRRETRNQQQQQQESLNHLKNGHTKQKATCKNKLKKGKKNHQAKKQTNKQNRTSFAAAKDGQESDRKTKRERDTEKEWRTGRGGKEFVRKRGRETTAASTVRLAGSPTASACQPTRGSRETKTPEDKGATGRYVRRSLTRPPDRPTDRPTARLPVISHSLSVKTASRYRG